MAWEFYAQLEPFDETRDDYRAASIIQMLYNVNRGKDSKALPLKDFLLRFEEEEKPKKTWQQMASMARMIAMIYNAEGITEK